MVTHWESYRHYKGGTFTLIGIAENSNERSEELAVYVSHQRRKLLVRPAVEFFGLVTLEDGTEAKRYQRIEEESP